MVQLLPLFVERKTPTSSVPAKRFFPITARDETQVSSGNPELTAVQLAPLFLDKKTPALVPTKRFVPLTA